jgi:hypothetical protein
MTKQLIPAPNGGACCARAGIRRAAEKRDDEVAASKPIEPTATDLGAQQRTPLLPIPVREQVQQNAPRVSTYSMISSASASSVGGISRPSAFAVFTC